MRKVLALIVLVLASSGCYHVTVNTGVAPGTRQINKPFANSFVFGLVPPATVDAQSECGGAGVASVETQQSFVNGLVSVITFGIYTPWQIDVTCGQGEEEQGEGEAPTSPR